MPDFICNYDCRFDIITWKHCNCVHFRQALNSGLNCIIFLLSSTMFKGYNTTDCIQITYLDYAEITAILDVIHFLIMNSMFVIS